MRAEQRDDPVGEPSGLRPEIERRVRFELLGSFRMMAAGAGPAATPAEGLGRKAQALLAYLAATPGHRASRERLAGLLWGERFDEQARQSLRQTLMALRRALGDIAPELLVVDRSEVALNAAAFATDLAEIERAAQDADPDRLHQAVALWRGDFLADLDIPSPAYEDWLRSLRETWRLRMAGMLMRLGRYQLEAGAGDAALLTVNRLVELDPLNEEARRLELAVLARFNGAAAALQSYQGFAALLDRELGVAPAAETRALASRLGQTSLSSAADSDTLPAVAALDERRVAGPPAAWRRAFTFLPLVAGLLLLAVAIGLMSGHVARQPEASTAVRPPQFSFHIPDATGDAFGAGFREDLKTRMALLPFAVIVADRQAAAFSIETAVQPAAAGQHAINLRLIDAGSGQTLWAESQTVPQDAAGRAAAAVAVRLYAELLNVLQQRRGPPPTASPALQPGWDSIIGGITRERVVQGRRFFQTALQATPDDPNAQLGMAHYITLDLVNRWSQQREADAILALDYLERVIQQMPRNITAYFTLGVLHKARRDYSRALADWQVVLAIEPRDSSTHSQIGYVNLLLGNLREGIEEAEMAIQLNPNARAADRAYFYAGMGYLMAGDYPRSEQYLAKAIAFNPALPDAYVWRVAALAQAGRQAEAEALYADVMRRFPWWNVDHHLTQAPDRSVMDRFASGLGKVIRPGH